MRKVWRRPGSPVKLSPKVPFPVTFHPPLNTTIHPILMQIGDSGECLQVHRCILALHSRVFRQMFANEHMVEAQEGVINITDSFYEPVCSSDR